MQVGTGACCVLGITDAKDKESYRKRIMWEELKVCHLNEISSGNDFEKIMTRLSIDSGDYVSAVFYGGGTLRRLHHLIGRIAKDIVTIKGNWKGTSWLYVAGVMVQSRMVSGKTPNELSELLPSCEWWVRFNESEMKQVIIMLNKSLQRVKSA